MESDVVTAPPLVSVIMPTFNNADMIGTAISSVLAQTEPRLELIVVNDGSTDDTRSVLDAYARTEPRFKPIHLLVNSGNRPAVPRNEGIRTALGTFVAFLDADDIWHPQKLERQLAQFSAAPGLALGYVLYQVAGPEGTLSGVFPAAPRRIRGAAFRPLFRYPVVPNSAVMVRREVFAQAGLLDEDPGIVEDWDMWLRISRFGVFDYVSGEPLMTYRWRPLSHSSGRWKPWRRMMTVAWKHRREAGLTLLAEAVIRHTAPFVLATFRPAAGKRPR